MLRTYLIFQQYPLRISCCYQLFENSTRLWCECQCCLSRNSSFCRQWTCPGDSSHGSPVIIEIARRMIMWQSSRYSISLITMMKRKRPSSAAQCGRMNLPMESAGPGQSNLQSRCHWFGRPNEKQEHLQAYRGREFCSRGGKALCSRCREEAGRCVPDVEVLELRYWKIW